MGRRRRSAAVDKMYVLIVIGVTILRVIMNYHWMDYFRGHLHGIPHRFIDIVDCCSDEVRILNKNM
jgi:hypothetical protein